MDLFILPENDIILFVISLILGPPLLESLFLLQVDGGVSFGSELCRSQFQDESLVHLQVTQRILVLFDVRPHLLDFDVQILDLLFLILLFGVCIFLQFFFVFLLFVVICNES